MSESVIACQGLYKSYRQGAASVSVLSGVDLVVNSLPVVNGMDIETDDNFRARFIVTLASYGNATMSAVQGAVASVQSNLKYNIVENYNFDGFRIVLWVQPTRTLKFLQRSRCC
jgi:hypothetical protein